MTASQAHHSAKTWLRVPSVSLHPAIPSPLNPANLLSSFKATNMAIYKKYTPGLWRSPNPSVFVIMMSTFAHSDATSGASVPLAYGPSLQYAQQNLAVLADRCGIERSVIEDPNWSYSFMVKGKFRTRRFWIKDLDHFSSLKMMNLDELDGGLGDIWFTDDEQFPFAFDLAGTFLADAYWGSAVVDDDLAAEVKQELFVDYDLTDTFLASSCEDDAGTDDDSIAKIGGEDLEEGVRTVDADALKITLTAADSVEEDREKSAKTLLSIPLKTADSHSKRVHFED